MTFDEDFLWGTATSAFQVEGRRGTRGDSIWDRFADAGRLAGGATGDVAVAHLDHLDADVALMSELGLTSYRFSVAWPRVQPDGRVTDPRGLDVYDRLVDLLLTHGITPMLTLYHWDLPVTVADEGGWPDRDTAERFAAYGADVAGRLGDRVRLWTTLNEPWCSAWLGYERGVHAPGERDRDRAVAAAHHLLLGHGLAVDAVRAAAPAAEVGITLNLARVDLGGTDRRDIDAGRLLDATQNRWFLDPVLRGTYPEEAVALSGGTLDDVVRPGDLDVISRPLDHFGLNYYRSFTVGHTDLHAGERPPGPGMDDVVVLPAEGPTTTLGWPIQPSGLTHLLTRLSREYDAPPLYVTETGGAFPDRVEDGVVDDQDRVAFLRSYVRAARRAIAAGVDLRGFTVWSLLDNLEWSEGFAPTFGIVAVDRETMVRTPKASAAVYARIAAGEDPVCAALP